VSTRSREIRLAARPHGTPTSSDFQLAEVELPDPGDGEILVRNAFVSVDPYMRGRMNDAKSYVPPFALGEALRGGAVGRVLASRDERWPVGTWVVHDHGWREAAILQGRGVRAVDPAAAPVSTALGVLGMPGLTAFVGIVDIAGVKEGETVFVSGAAGAVGSAAAQLARSRGARVIGSAGTREKVAWLRELGLAAAFDYHESRVRDALRELAPDGIDVYFDNVGGETLEAAIGAMRLHGRIVACGSISRYNATEALPGPRNMFMVVTKRLRMQGFIVSDHGDRFPAFLGEVGPLVADGTIRYRETVVDGIERAPEAFIGMLEGANVGKMLVRVGPGPGES
jgi:NADPH-dependent curcumin reductase CurA